MLQNGNRKKIELVTLPGGDWRGRGRDTVSVTPDPVEEVPLHLRGSRVPLASGVPVVVPTRGRDRVRARVAATSGLGVRVLARLLQNGVKGEVDLGVVRSGC